MLGHQSVNNYCRTEPVCMTPRKKENGRATTALSTPETPLSTPNGAVAGISSDARCAKIQHKFQDGDGLWRASRWRKAKLRDATPSPPAPPPQRNGTGWSVFVEVLTLTAPSHSSQCRWSRCPNSHGLVNDAGGIQGDCFFCVRADENEISMEIWFVCEHVFTHSTCTQ